MGDVAAARPVRDTTNSGLSTVKDLVFPAGKRRPPVRFLRRSGIFLSFLLFLAAYCQAQRATISQRTEQIKTYPYSDPNPIPALAIDDLLSRFYPYFMWNGYTDKSVPRNWEVVTLQNPYLKVTVLPQVGGKVWGATEKSTGKAFVYRNQVLKFRAIGIRGPWTSGGIEHNFGLDLGHAPWTASPVDYILKENKDGSVSCIVGGLALASRTQWRVEIRLPKDKAYFETTSLWFNPLPLHDSYLAWENAAFKATRGLEFYFPGDHTIYHSGAAHPWPVDGQGRQLSLYRENDFGGNKSYHVMGTYNNWYGGYWHEDDLGFGHWARYSEAPGKKIWIWALSRQGAIWENLLTDTDGQYIEAQAGVKFNQASPTSGYHSPFDQLSLGPGYTDTKTDVWFPVKGTGGMVDASPYGTLNTAVEGDSLTISISPTTAIQDSLIVSKDGKRIYAEFLRLQPMQGYHKTLPLRNGQAENTCIRLGESKLSHTLGTSIAEENKINRPVKTATPPKHGSVPWLLQVAHDENAMRDYGQALEDYLAVLKKAPGNIRALSMVAELYYRQARYREGAEYALRALKSNTYDGSANFIYGALLEKQGRLIGAEEAYSIASLTMEYRAAAYSRIAALAIKRRQYDKAVTYARKALDYNRKNLNAYEFLGTAYRKLQKPQKAAGVFARLLAIDPLNHYARFEQYLLDPSPETLAHFKSLIRNEFPVQTYLELALQYATREGLTTAAVRLLKQAPSSPLVYYWLAHLDSSRRQHYLEEAEKMPPDFVFPFRPETIPVLSRAVKQRSSWKPKYYLGLLYWRMHRPAEARALLQSCGDTPDYAPFYLARGRLLDNDASLSDYTKAVSGNPREWRTWHYLITFHRLHQAFKQALEQARKAYRLFPQNPIIGLDYAEALYNGKAYEKALDILKSVYVLPQEHARKGHAVYEKANLALALKKMRQKQYRAALRYLQQSQAWPEHLGEGKPFDPDTRLQDYMAAYCMARLGDTEKHDRYMQKITDFTLKHWTLSEHGPSTNAAGIYIGANALKRAGKATKARELVDQWRAERDSLNNWRILPGPADPAMQWVIAKSEGNESLARRLTDKLRDEKQDEFQLFLKFLALTGEGEERKN